ncbi:MAG: NHL repeat-containing protein, partial [Anaerolineales bacterium]|nr:NHL repeat-containing protein [Anaerolineales bacterium]
MKKVIALVLAALSLAASPALASTDPPYNTWAWGAGFGPVATQAAYLPLDEVELDAAGPEDLFVAADGLVYVADTGNARILKLKDFQVAGTYGEDVLKGPTGLYVTPDGTMYIADAGQDAIVILAADGTLLNQFGRPAEPLFGKNREFLPRKIAVDARGNLFIVSEGSVDGIVQMSRDGHFLGYFGANTAAMSLKMILQRLFLTPEQLAQFVKNEAASPSNLDLDAQSLLYTVTAGTDIYQGIRRYTVAGKNIYPETYGSRTFRDIRASADGLVVAVDANGQVWEKNTNGWSLFWFGAKDLGDQRLGTLTNPVAIDRDGDFLYVLDKDKNAIVVYQATA